MKKILLLPILLILYISFVYGACPDFERLALFDRPNNYTLDGTVYTVSIKEAQGTLNAFIVTIDGVTYSQMAYGTSSLTEEGVRFKLGDPYAASSVMYTSIDFCMEKLDVLENAPSEVIQSGFEKDSNYVYYILGGIIVILGIIIIYLLFKRKK